MKKRRIFKDWVSYTLICLQALFVVIVSGECEGCTLTTEFGIKAPFVCLMIINHILIARHTEFYTNGF